MKLKEFFAKIRQVLSSPLLVDESDRHRIATIIYLSTILLVASLFFLISTLGREQYTTVLGVLAGDAILVVSIFLAHRGKITFVSYTIPISLFALATFVAFRGFGLHDITLLAFPMIVAIAGLLQNKLGVLITASIGTLCLSLIYLGETIGLIPRAVAFQEYTSIGDVLIMGILLWVTATSIYFSTGRLHRSLESMRKGEQALRKANDAYENYSEVLEQRTGQLLTGARVSRAASSILDPDELGQQVVELVCTRFGLYYVGLFLVEKGSNWAVLRAATGEAGKQMLSNGHRLKVGSMSMIGWCIANKKARIALDIGAEAVRFDNPLLPKTRSELAFPLISRGQVIGALSIQSEKEGAFSEEDIISFQTMGDQLANAIRSAQLYGELQMELAQRRRAEKKIRNLNKELEDRVAVRTSELQAANERLTALSQLKDEFVSNVSHELRTPITSIMLYHSMIDTNPQDAKRYVNTLKRETNRLAHLIEDLLFLSRLDQGRFNFNPKPVDINRLVEEYATDRAPLAANRHLTITVSPTSSIPVVQADEQMIGQVLSIILTNAINYTPENGHIIIRTQAATKQAQQWVGFTVSDTGPGISPEECQRLFERFFRGKAGRESATPGTGLGLAIAREIVDKHKGLIEVESQGLGQGATFGVWLHVWDPG